MFNLKSTLKDVFPNSVIKKKYFSCYDYEIVSGDKIYHLKKLNVNSSSILNINSQYFWEIKKGRLSGSNFKTSSKKLIDMRDFVDFDHKIVVFRSKPFKIFKYINESEIVDVSNVKEINDILIFNSVKAIKNS